MNLEQLKAILDKAKETGQPADLSHANLFRANLSGADLRHANLSHADLRYTNLSHANLFRANLRYANLSHADLRYTNLSGANLSRADLRKANLNWQSHELIAEILRQAATTTNHRCIAGLILVSPDWCWDRFSEELSTTQKNWARSILNKFANDDNPPPKEMQISP